MFPNLNAELSRLGITIKELSDRTKIPYRALPAKLRGIKPLTFAEARTIKAAISSDLPLEVLFSQTIAV